MTSPIQVQIPMATHDLSTWVHGHDFAGAGQHQAEQRTRWVVALTLGAMVVELIAGWLTGSMALLADGWHMGSHAAALGISAYAYSFARSRRADARFTFGTGKVPSLAGYTSALLLAGGAFWMLAESMGRLVDPVAIRYQDALAVAVFGLAVNLVSAWLLGHEGHDHAHERGPQPHAQGHGDAHHRHGHAHDRAHDQGHTQQDHNLRAAYLHVLADALTSLLAILALSLGLIYGWGFLDPVMGIAGGLLIAGWSWGLARDSAAVLMDAEDHREIARRVRDAIESDGDNAVTDLHIWRVAPAGRACIVSLVTHEPRPVEHYRALVSEVPGLLHLTVEVQHCRQCDGTTA